MDSKINVEELAENFKVLSIEDRAKLKAILGEEWFVTTSEEEQLLIKSLIEKSVDQHKKGETKSYENILQESRKKYGM